MARPTVGDERALQIQTTDEQQRLLADAVERILSEPFAVRELEMLSPYVRERSTAGQALATPTADARLTSRQVRVTQAAPTRLEPIVRRG